MSPLVREEIETDRLDQVIRGDGTIVELERAIGPKQEFKEFLYMFKDIRMLLLFPMFFSSNYCRSMGHHIGSYLFQSTHTKEPSPPFYSTVELEPSSLSLPV
jgi:hypothetical protein